MVLFSLIFISGLLLLLSNEQNIALHITAFLTLSVGSMAIVKFNLLHPYCWYSLIFTLYSISYPILYLENIITKFGYKKELMILQWLALVTFLLVFSPHSNISLQVRNSILGNNFKKRILELIFKVYLKYKKLSFINKLVIKTQRINLKTRLKGICSQEKIIKLIINLICLTILISCVLIVKEGYTSKREIYASGNIFINLSFKLAIILTVLYLFQLLNKLYKENKIDSILFLKTWISIVALTLFSGERDLLFRLIIITTFGLYLFKKIKNIYILIAAPFVMLLLPLSHMFKYFFLTGTINKLNIFSFRGLICEFLNGEFLSASKNLQIILNNSDWTEGVFRGNTILNDFIRVFSKTDFSHGKWFMDSFFPDTTRVQYGFSLVGVGYVNFGYLGVILVFFLVAVFLRILYKNANKNIYFMTIYLYTIPLYMYSIRADLANIFSPFIKHLFLSIILIYGSEIFSDFIEYKKIYKLKIEGYNNDDI